MMNEATHSDESAIRTSGEKPWTPLSIPEIGIEFKRYHSKDCEVFICEWRNDSASHVYEIRVRRDGDLYRATCSNDGRKLVSMAGPSRAVLTRFALGGFRQYLRRGHRKTLRTVNAEPSNPQPPTPNPQPSPLNPQLSTLNPQHST